MNGEKDLHTLIKTFKPVLNSGEYVFCNIDEINSLNFSDFLFVFKEQEGITVVVRKEIADGLKLEYSYISSWITLDVYSSLHAVGFTAAFSTALANEGISCNVVAAFYHDHIFVDIKNASQAMEILNRLSEQTFHE
jgi:hypothetical protein